MKDNTINLDEQATLEEESVEVVNDLEERKEETVERPAGYMTKEEFIAAGNDPKDYVSPEEFERRGATFNYIKSLKEQVSALVQSQKRLEKKAVESEMVGYQRAIAELSAQREEAEEALDVKAVRALDNEILHQQQAMQNAMKATVSKETQEFANKYKEKLSDRATLDRAIACEQFLRLSHPDLTEREIYTRLEKELFGTTTTSESKVVPMVASARSAYHPVSDKVTFHDLTDHGKAIYKSFKADDPNYSLKDLLKASKETDMLQYVLKNKG